MKKIKSILLIITVFLFSIFTINVKAAGPAVVWIVGGEEISNTDSSTDYATVIKDGLTVTLKLNNYVGSGLVEEYRGGTLDGEIKFIIELTGDNVITDDSIGILLNDKGKIEFTGTGTLKINAPTPISYESYKNTMIIKPAENVYTDVEKVEDTSDAKEEVTTIESEDKTIGTTEMISNNNLIYIAFGIYFIASLIIIILLITKLPKKE